VTPHQASAVFTIHVTDLPSVTAKIKGLLRENELLRARVAELEDGQQDAASQALQQANLLMNRH